MLAQNLEELEAWAKARELTLEIYAASGQKPFFSDSALCHPLRRTCVALLTELTETFHKGATPDADVRLNKAKELVGEIRTQLYTALDRKYLGSMIFNQLFDLATQTGRTIESWKSWLSQSNQRGGAPRASA